jgi:deoxycytidine triphosphate deaminase
MSTETELVRHGWLTGNEIIKQVHLKRITIAPFDEQQINPNSYNYRLFRNLRRLKNPIIDLKVPDEFDDLVIPEAGILLEPNECYLGSTLETFGSDHFASLITGRSSVGRKFITNHVTAGLIDQGFFGQITLEITVQKPTRVYAGSVFGQIFWFSVVGEPRLYRGKYAAQREPTGSRAHLDLD